MSNVMFSKNGRRAIARFKNLCDYEVEDSVVNDLEMQEERFGNEKYLCAKYDDSLDVTVFYREAEQEDDEYDFEEDEQPILITDVRRGDQRGLALAGF